MTLTYMLIAAAVAVVLVLLQRVFRAGRARGAAVEKQTVTELRAEVEHARQVADAERDKSSRYFAKISDFERERDQWQQLYTQQSIGHGNAQNLMMQTIERMARILQEKGVRVQIPKALHQVREEFVQNHELPAREIAAKTAENKAISQANKPPVTDAPAGA